MSALQSPDFHSDRLKHYLFGKLSPPDAEDAYQDVCLALLEQIAKGNSIEAIGPYAKTIARRRVGEQIGRLMQERSHKPIDDETKDTAAPDCLHTLLSRETMDCLHAAIAQLKEEDRRMITLFLRGFSITEISQKMETTPHAISCRKLRVLSELRDALNNSSAPVMPNPSPNKTARAFSRSSLSHGLSERQRQIVECFVRDELEVKEIATALGMSMKTASAHKSEAMKKLGCQNDVQLVKAALRLGWATLDQTKKTE